MNILSNTQIDYVNDAVSAASNTDDNSTILDMSGFEGVCFVVPITDSAATGTATLSIEASTSNADTYMTAVTGAIVTGTCTTSDDLNGMLLVVDVYRPQKRYVQGTITSGTANMAFGATTAIRYSSKSKPITQDSDTVAASAVAVGS